MTTFIGTVPYSLVTPSGQVIQTGRAMELPEVPGLETIAEEAPSLDHYRDGGQWVKRPDQPSLVHVFDWAAKTWVDPRTLDQLKAEKRVSIDAERARRSVAPIVYSERNVDADARAQKNISDKLAEIKAREDMGVVMPAELLLWRDADNLTVTFDTMAQMKVWLQGLVVAIAQRGTEAYVWAWQMKALVDAAASAQDLPAFD